MDYKLHSDFCLLRSGEWMNGFTSVIGDALLRCGDLCFRLNSLPPSQIEERGRLLREIIGKIGSRFVVHSPFRCDLGFNISIGENFVGNFNLTILDEAEVAIGEGAVIGAGSVVTKNVAPATVVAGNPARFLRNTYK